MPSPLPSALLPPPSGPLDFLGRLPIPLRRPFKQGLDRTLARLRQQGEHLQGCFLQGAEWYRPFDGLLKAATGPHPEAELPGLIVSHFAPDIFQPELLAHYRGAPLNTLPALDGLCQEAGLADPAGEFHVFANIPFVFLVDTTRLGRRPMPRAWEDLLDPCYADEIVFGGWRGPGQSHYQDYNEYILRHVFQNFGSSGLQAFAHNVARLQHNIRTASSAGSNSPHAATIAIIPWLQAELCPRRQRTQVIWPDEGALVMPIGFLVQAEAVGRLQPLIDFLTGPELGRQLGHNCYPPARQPRHAGYPPGARLSWQGWAQARHPDLAETGKLAARIFFGALACKGPLCSPSIAPPGAATPAPPREIRRDREAQPCN